MAGDFYGRLRSYLGIGPAPVDMGYVAPAPVGWGSDPLKTGSGRDLYGGRGANSPAPAPAGWGNPRGASPAEQLSRWQQALPGPASAPVIQRPVMVDQLETGVGATPIRPQVAAPMEPLPSIDWAATRPQAASAVQLPDLGPALPPLPPLHAPAGSALADVAEAATMLTAAHTPAASPNLPNVRNLEAAMGQSDLESSNLGLSYGPRQGFGTDVDLTDSMISRPPAPAPVAPAAGGADAAVAQATARRTAGAGKRNAFDAALDMADLGIGRMARHGLRNTAAIALKNNMPKVARGLASAGNVAAVAAPALAYGAALLPVATGAIEGYQQAGTGGALIQGGTAGGGALIGGLLGSAVLGGFGTVIGAGLGSALGSAGGGLLTKGAMAAVDAAEAGNGGFMGAIGNALDPILDSTFEKEQKDLLRMDNSPVMARIRDEQKLREAKARQAQTEQLLYSIYAT